MTLNPKYILTPIASTKKTTEPSNLPNKKAQSEPLSTPKAPNPRDPRLTTKLYRQAGGVYSVSPTKAIHLPSITSSTKAGTSVSIDTNYFAGIQIQTSNNNSQNSLLPHFYFNTDSDLSNGFQPTNYTGSSATCSKQHLRPSRPRWRPWGTAELS